MLGVVVALTPTGVRAAQIDLYAKVFPVAQGDTIPCTGQQFPWKLFRSMGEGFAYMQAWAQAYDGCPENQFRRELTNLRPSTSHVYVNGTITHVYDCDWYKKSDGSFQGTAEKCGQIAAQDFCPEDNQLTRRVFKDATHQVVYCAINVVEPDLKSREGKCDRGGSLKDLVSLNDTESAVTTELAERLAANPPAMFPPDLKTLPDKLAQLDRPGDAVGNPILVTVGIKYQRELDLSLPGGLRLERTYRSDFGTWTSNLHMVGLNRSESNSDTVLQSSSLGGMGGSGCVQRRAQGLDDVLCFEITGSPSPISFQMIRANGRYLKFEGTGVPVAASDVNDRLTGLTDQAGVLTGWSLLRAEDNAQEQYDLQGRLLSVTQLTGQTHRYTYLVNGAKYPASAPTCTGIAGGSPSSKVQCVTDAFGRQLNFAYDSAGRLLKVRTPRGDETLYEHNGPSAVGLPAGDLVSVLTKVTFPGAAAKTYHYNESALNGTGAPNRPAILTGITDEKGIRLSSFGYAGPLGQVAFTEQAGGVNRYSIEYVSLYSYHRVTDPLGSVYSYNLVAGPSQVRPQSVTQPPGTGCPAATYTDDTIDGNGNTLRTIDRRGVQTTYTYDTARNLETSRTEAAGTASARVTTSQWHPVFRLRTRLAQPERITTWVYNGQPDPTNANAVLTCVPPGTPALPNAAPVAVVCKQVEQATTDATGALGFGAAASGTPRVWTYAYNADGQLLTANGPRTDLTDLTTIAYYTATDTAVPSKWRRGDVQQVTDARGWITVVNEYDADGRPVRVTDPNGAVTSATYHPRGWLATLTQSAGGVSQTTTFDYWPTGQIKKVTEADTSAISFDYDNAQRLTTVSDSVGNTISYTLDNLGNATEEQAKTNAGVLRRKVSRAFDALGRMQSLTGARQ